MEDMFGLETADEKISESNDQLPTLSHVVDLLGIGQEQVAAVHEEVRLGQSQERLFAALDQLWSALEALGCDGFKIFEDNDRLRPMLRFYIAHLYSRSEYCPPTDSVKLCLSSLKPYHRRIGRLYEQNFAGAVTVEARKGWVTFSGYERGRLSYPAQVHQEGTVDVDGPLFSVMLNYFKTDNQVELELGPDQCRVNRTCIYPRQIYRDDINPSQLPHGWRLHINNSGVVRVLIGKEPVVLRERMQR